MSADVFGLAATHDLGIGQHPAKVGKVVDAIYPMTYPSHYSSGEFNLTDPNAEPAPTVMLSLRDFRAQLAGGKALLVPWLQDFSLGRTYTPADVAAQISSARTEQTGGFMLWNASGLYTAGALRAGPPPPLPELPRRSSRPRKTSAVWALFVHALGYGEGHGDDARDPPADRDPRAEVPGDPRPEGAGRRRSALDLPADRRRRGRAARRSPTSTATRSSTSRAASAA